MLSTSFLPTAVAPHRPVAISVLTAAVIPSLVHAARAAIDRRGPARGAGRAATSVGVAGTAPRCLR